jgi:hypothetical protein
MGQSLIRKPRAKKWKRTGGAIESGVRARAREIPSTPLEDESVMTRRRRNFKFSWKSKRANHGRKGARGKLKRWGKKN